jgi:hypothetical protein
MFKIGQKVVCVDDSVNPETVEYTPCRPRKGQIYTVRGFLTQPHIHGYGVYLEELLNPSLLWSDQDEKEWPFRSTRFRSLVEPRELETAVTSAPRGGPSDV